MTKNMRPLFLTHSIGMIGHVESAGDMCNTIVQIILVLEEYYFNTEYLIFGRLQHVPSLKLSYVRPFFIYGKRQNKKKQQQKCGNSVAEKNVEKNCRWPFMGWKNEKKK